MPTMNSVLSEIILQMGEQNENSSTEMKVENFPPSQMHHKNSQFLLERRMLIPGGRIEMQKEK